MVEEANGGKAMSKTHVCASRTCKNRFTPEGNRKKFCSFVCSKRENQRKYAEAHPEQVSQSMRAWAERNRQKVREYRRDYQRRWRAANLERERRRARKDARNWRKEHHDQFIKTQRRRYAAKHEIILEQRRAREGSIPRAEYLKIARKARMRELDALARRDKGGRPATRAHIFAEANKLHQAGFSWDKIAKQLIPSEHQTDREIAAERIKRGARYHEKQRTKESTTRL